MGQNLIKNAPRVSLVYVRHKLRITNYELRIIKMPSNPTVLDNLNKLRAVDVTNLPTGATLTVRSPGAGLPPGSYTLLDSAIADYPPIVISPIAGGSRKWIAHNNLVIREINPNTTPPFINLELINIINSSVHISVNTTSAAGWFAIQGAGGGTGV